MKSVQEQFDIIKKGVAEILPEEQLIQKLTKSYQTQKPLYVKLGFDPSNPDLHLGHAIVLNKLRQFQDLGHRAILIIGDFTAMIGDPTGRNKTRPPLSLEKTRENGKIFQKQAMKILDYANTEELYNSSWLSKLSFQDLIEISSKFTVSQMLERSDFHSRFQKEIPISLHEFLYPLAQAMDSVHTQADIELGGTDQKFNLLMGRSLQKDFNLEQQCIITMPILAGIDGNEKMSKSLNNYVGLDENPNEIFGKILSIQDADILKWLTLCTNEPINSEIESKIRSSPRDMKRFLARKIISQYHSEEIAQKAQDHFDKLFIKKEAPDNIPEFLIDKEQNLLQFLVDKNLLESKNEGKRLVNSGAISVNGQKITDISFQIGQESEQIVKIGKRKFIKIKVLT